jgi:hypothetical protein
MDYTKLDDAAMGDANGDFLGNGAVITHQSSAASREHAAADDIVTHRLHLLSRRMYKKKWIG